MSEIKKIYVKLRDNGGVFHDSSTGNMYVSNKVYHVEESLGITRALRSNCLLKLEKEEGAEIFKKQEAEFAQIVEAEKAAIEAGTPEKVILAKTDVKVVEPKKEEDEKAIDVLDYSKMNYGELKAEAEKRNLGLSADAKKTVIIEALKADDAKEVK